MRVLEMQLLRTPPVGDSTEDQLDDLHRRPDNERLSCAKKERTQSKSDRESPRPRHLQYTEVRKHSTQNASHLRRCPREVSGRH